jgi:hypothetical protein
VEITREQWDELYEANEAGFWRLVRFEAEHEPDRLDYYMELEKAERHRKERDRIRRAALLPPSEPGILTLEEALGKLEAVRSTGPGKWMARCPVHEDDEPSLSIADSDVRPGYPIFNCFAGCDFRSIRDILTSTPI